MARNIVPPDGVNNLTVGTKLKRWLKGFFSGLDVSNGANAPVNTLQRSTTYAVGDVVQSDAVHAKYFLKCTTAGTTGSTEPDFTGAVPGSTIVDGTAVWTLMEFASTEYADKAAEDSIMALVDSAPGTLDTLAELAAALGDDPNFATTIATLIDTKCAQAKLDAHPVGSFYESTNPTSPATLFGGTWQEQIPDGELVGSVAAFSGSTLPAGWLLCNGSAVSRTDYADLYSVIGDTYGAGDGSTTFNVPNLIDKFIEGSATSGTEHSAGLPNITGVADLYRDRGGIDPDTTNGVFYGGDPSANIPLMGEQVEGYRTDGYLYFDASHSSSIYGNSTTVQPPALTMRYAIYSGVVSKKLWLRTV